MEAEDDQRSSPVTKLCKPRNLEATMQELRFLSDMAIIKLARLQSWYIPGYYPFVFPGQIRGGPGTGPPPILGQVSAGAQSSQLLKQFIRKEGVIDIPRNILIVDTDTGMRRLLPEVILTPIAHQFNHTVNPTTFSVSLSHGCASDTGTDQADTDHGDEEDDNDEEIVFDENPIRGVSDDLDDTVQMGENPAVTSLNPQTLANLQADSRFAPGSDELGMNFTSLCCFLLFKSTDLFYLNKRKILFYFLDKQFTL